MPWPSALTVITLPGTIVSPDEDQTPGQGIITFHMPFALYIPADDVVVAPQPISAAVVNGTFSVELPATNDPDVSPSGWTYRVVVNTDVWKATYELELPYTTTPGTRFEDIPPAVTPTTVATYSPLGHTHSDLVAKSTLTTKGDIFAATGAGTVVRLGVGANGQALIAQSGAATGLAWGDIVGGSLSGFMGTWDAGVEYEAGAIVQYGDLLYGAIDGAPAGQQPDTVVPLNTAVPTTTATGDSTDYQFVAQVTASELTRVEGIDFYKLAGQSAVPHELRAYDISWGTTSPLATATVLNESGGAVGFQTAPMIGDMRAGKTYGFTFVAGTVGEDTYAYTAGFGFGGQVGALTLVAGGFVASHANITTISSPTTYYTGVGPRFRRRNAYWTRLVGGAPVWIGSNRTVTYAPA